MKAHLYHKDTGIFTGTILMGHPDSIALNTPPDHAVYHGEVNHRTHKMDITSGKLVPHQGAPSMREQLSGFVRSTNSRKHLEAQLPMALAEVLLGKDGALQRLQALYDQIQST